jgi:hypothetical protein
MYNNIKRMRFKLKNTACKYFNYKNLALVFILALIVSVTFLTQANAQGRREHTERRGPAPGRVMSLPRNSMIVTVGPQRYFYHEGAFYARTRGGFSVIAAPIGARISVLPVGFVSLRFGALDYYYFNGVYYNYLPDQQVYVVVQKPAGADNVSNLKLDNVLLYNGSTLQGIFQGATDSTITLRVGDQDREINISDIISINFAPQINDNSQQK